MQVSPTSHRIRELVTPGQAPASGTAAIWLPWLAAPLFMAAPIGGCALAERSRPSMALAEDRPGLSSESGSPMVPAGPDVTAGKP